MFIAMSVSVNKTYSAADLKFLNLLSEKFPTIADATTEIINLEAILNLPKGTEHFLTDLHGEYEAFRHVLKNASGVSQSSSGFIAGRSASVSSMRWRESVSFMKPASAVCTSPTSTTRVPADR